MKKTTLQTSESLKRINSQHPGGNVFQQPGTIFKLIQNIIKTYVLAKCHEDWTMNVTFRESVKNAPPPGSYCFQPTGTCPRYHLEKSFDDDWTINVASRVKNGPLPWGHVFQANGTIYKLVQYIIGTNLQTKFHGDWTINVASRKKSPATWQPYFSTNQNHKLIQYIINVIRTIVLTKFHEELITNVTFRVLTRIKYPPSWQPCFSTDEKWTINITLRVKHAPTPGGNVFQPTGTIFHENWTINVASRVLKNHITKNTQPPGVNTINVASRVLTRTNAPTPLRQYIIGTNFLTKFHDYREINPHKEKCTAPGHIFQATISELVQDIIGKNLLSKFHEDRTINLASRVLTRKTAPRPGGNVFQPTGNNLELFHDDMTTNVAFRVKNSTSNGGHVFPPTEIIFEFLVKTIIGTNLLAKFHEYQTINVASGVLTKDKAPPPGGHVFQATMIIFELIQYIIGTNLLTKFNED
ncbi:hypothetical protein DPMN_011513 [Dreissena polymorpha]|uniref:Uncharacterized protein n=1 Tax=Dreissena polymorpha TaxID=45954 RepID=A0A9D4N3S5_DREPO|nr:hypothetical protein DPMN_011513 [Dreissena polymorpha]